MCAVVWLSIHMRCLLKSADIWLQSNTLKKQPNDAPWGTVGWFCVCESKPDQLINERSSKRTLQCEHIHGHKRVQVYAFFSFGENQSSQKQRLHMTLKQVPQRTLIWVSVWTKRPTGRATLFGTVDYSRLQAGWSAHLSLSSNGRGSCRCHRRSAKCYQNKAL